MGTVKVPNTGTIIIWTHKINTAGTHILEWVALLLRFLYFIRVGQPEFPEIDNEALQKVGRVDPDAL